MNFRDSVASALRAIVANKLRSFLTMLGVVIGVGSVIAMIGIGEGTKRKSLENIEVMGTNMLTVVPNWQRGNQSMGAGSATTLKDEDVAYLKRTLPQFINLISGAVNGRNVTVKFADMSYNTSVLGCEPQMATIRNATKMQYGSWFTFEDNAVLAQKAVLGYMVWDQLFHGDNPVGATIKVKGQNYEVTGVVAYKGGSGWNSPDDQIYIPLKTAQKRLLGHANIDQIVIQGVSQEILPYTQMRVEAAMAAKRHSAVGDELFRVFNQGEWIDQIQQQTQLLSFLLAGIASVSLLVGGIGIMNIMLVSVTERTREIGLRKAVGATRETILSQFLLESIVMCISGGVIGIILGYAATTIVARFLKVPPVLNVGAIALAFGFSAMVGLFFGLYPAIRASRLEPIEALRYE